jgi:hypothetical protein
MSRRSFLVAAVLVGCLALAVGAWLKFAHRGDRKTPLQANFEKIADGMTEEELTALLGPPRLTLPVRPADKVKADKIVQWYDGRQAIAVHVKDGKVVAKHLLQT